MSETKSCKIKLKYIENVEAIIHVLLINGYSANVRTKFKEFPRENDIDYFIVEIYDESTEKGGEQE